MSINLISHPDIRKSGFEENIFGSKGAEVTGGWRKLLNKELHYLHTRLDEY
jgi:hypothetical protein